MAWGTCRKQFTKPSEQVAAPPSIFESGKRLFKDGSAGVCLPSVLLLGSAEEASCRCVLSYRICQVQLGTGPEDGAAAGGGRCLRLAIRAAREDSRARNSRWSKRILYWKLNLEMSRSVFNRTSLKQHIHLDHGGQRLGFVELNYIVCPIRLGQIHTLGRYGIGVGQDCRTSIINSTKCSL